MTEIDLIQRIKNLPAELSLIIFKYYEDFTKYRMIKTLTGHSDPIWSLSVLLDGTLVSASDDRTIKIWNVKSGKCIKTLKGHRCWINVLAVLSDGTLASGSDDNTINIWDVKTGECIKTLKGHIGYVSLLAVLPDGTLASSGVDK